MTKLIYLDNMCTLSCQAHVQEVRHDQESAAIILDQTVFYPQGGGQPADKGVIKNEQATFVVHGVTKDADIVLHKGIFTHGQMFKEQDEVELQVDPDIRALHNRNHTGGHLVDYALVNLGYSFTSHKAYHFPQGPYVEYVGIADEVILNRLRVVLESAVNELVQQDLSVSINLIDNDPKKRAMSLPGYEPIFCGGTHVQSTAYIGHITIRKIKNEKGNLRVSYAVQ